MPEDRESPSERLARGGWTDVETLAFEDLAACIRRLRESGLDPYERIHWFLRQQQGAELDRPETWEDALWEIAKALLDLMAVAAQIRDRLPRPGEAPPLTFPAP